MRSTPFIPPDKTPPSCNDRYGSSCHWVNSKNSSHWNLVFDPKCPVHGTA